MFYKFVRSAITGPICSGKTTISDQLKNKGSIIISWDDIYSDLLKHDKLLQTRIKTAFSIYDKSGKSETQNIIDSLKSVVFTDKKALAFLNSITHPIISKKAFEKEKELVKNYESSGQQSPDPDELYPLVVHEVPLLYQAGLQNKFDRIYICLAANATLLDRVQKRYDIDKQEAQRRIDATQFNFPVNDDKVIVVNT
ncbi:MAG: dephospho-CoA kinase [Bifidobacteriaceae bacterium]|jgi:dephospho-CoA kinase|nr:dephospho-CoA kinase [Bifidobacteriaceae bacterium]